MAAFCGWFEANLRAAPEALASSMAAGLAATPGPLTVVAMPQLGLVVAGAQAWRAVDGLITVAVDGEPGFADAAVSRIARSEGPARAIGAAYERVGVEFPRMLRGAYAVILIDLAKGVAVAAVDRMGIRPLCFARGADASLVFGSTAAAVAQHPAVGARISRQALFDYTYVHVIPAPRTVFANVSKLRLSEQLVCARSGITLSQHWQPRFGADGAQRRENLAAELKSRLTAAVDRAVDNGPVGSFLSGGLDSSSVTGMAAATGRLAHAYTIGFKQEGYDESAFARLAAKHFKADLKLYYLSPEDVAGSIRTVAAGYDEPFGNSSAVPVLFCARNARADGVSTMLAGDGGDELFGGNERYLKQKLFDYYSMLPAILRRGAIDPVAALGRRAPGVGPLWKLYRYVTQAREPAGARAAELFDQLKGMQPSTIFQPELIREIDAGLPARELQATFDSAPADSNLDRMLYLDWKITLADNDLRKVNRMCELNGVRVRYPMLDDDVVDLSTRVPPGMKIRGRKLRDFYKRSFADFLPREIIFKRKHGFGLPFGEWLKTEPVLRELTYPALQRLKARGIYRAECIDTLVTTHRDGHASYYGGMVWALLMLELWLDEHRISL